MILYVYLHLSINPPIRLSNYLPAYICCTHIQTYMYMYLYIHIYSECQYLYNKQHICMYNLHSTYTVNVSIYI